MGKVVVMDHPLIQHKIGLMRRTETGSKDFRTLAGEVAMFECYEATRDLELQDVEIETPICKTTVKELKGKKLAVVGISHQFECQSLWNKGTKTLSAGSAAFNNESILIQCIVVLLCNL